MKTQLLYGVLRFVAAAFLVSCSVPDPDAPTDRNVHPAAWINPTSMNNHGATVESEGSESCTDCHGLDLGGSGSVSGCTACHFDVLGSRIPSGSAWTHGATPHDALIGQSKVCNNCHTVYRKFGLLPASCHDCHGTGGATHPLGSAWLDRKSGTFHGIPAKQDISQCAACHGNDYKGGSSGVSCAQCHFGPSGSKGPSGWTHHTTSHKRLGSSMTVCNQCHSLDRTYGNGPSSCHDCHGDGGGD